MLKRKIEMRLTEWKNTPGHKPLIIKGCRQCGKTFSVLEFAKKNYTNYEVESILDLGSGINFNKKGLNKLILMIINKDLSVLVINHKERLLRFGFELINQICILNNIKIVIIEEQKNNRK